MRKTFRMLAAGYMFAAASTAAAQSGHPHVHGLARLDVAVDNEILTIILESPLENLLGFEHAARNDRERDAVQAMADKLRQPGALFITSAAAQCRSVSVALHSPVLENHAGKDGEGHVDLEGEFVFRCQQPQKLNDLAVQLFAAFPHLRQIEARMATSKRQTWVKLTPEQNRLHW